MFDGDDMAAHRRHAISIGVEARRALQADALEIALRDVALDRPARRIDDGTERLLGRNSGHDLLVA